MKLSKPERLAIFAERLMTAPAASSAEEAIEMIASILNDVEDEFSSIPYDRSLPTNDGRMYPPLPDSARDVAGRPDLTRYRNRGHSTYVGENGAIRIIATGSSGDGTLLSKPGSDGREVTLS
jgi:hypothetical protein